MPPTVSVSILGFHLTGEDTTWIWTLKLSTLSQKKHWYAQCQKSIETLQEVVILSLREEIPSKPSSDYCDVPWIIWTKGLIGRRQHILASHSRSWMFLWCGGSWVSWGKVHLWCQLPRHKKITTNIFCYKVIPQIEQLQSRGWWSLLTASSTFPNVSRTNGRKSPRKNCKT